MKKLITESVKARGKILLFAFVMSIALWYNVTGKEKVDTWVTVKVTYTGIPTNLTVVSGLEERLSVRVRTARGLVSTLQGRDYFTRIDLSHITRGNVEVPIPKSQMPFNGIGVYEVIDINPPRLQLAVENVVEKIVPVKLVYDALPPNTLLRNVNIKPSSVVVRGTAKEIGGIKNIPLQLSAQDLSGLGAKSFNRDLPTPEQVSLAPAQVHVEFELVQARKNISLERKISGNLPPQYGYNLSSQSATVTFSIPETLADDLEKLAADVKVVFHMDSLRLRLGTQPMPLKVNLPDSAELLRVEPAQVNVTVFQKHADRTENNNAQNNR